MLQEVVKTLESYKRHVGRQYNKAVCREDLNKALDWWHEYNHTENQIRFICDNYGVTRASKPYKLSINAPALCKLADVD
jgi:hypothetical protein